MAVPKRRTSSTKRGMRRSHDGITGIVLSACANCGQLTRPHAACIHCGTYQGRSVKGLKDLKETKEKKKRQKS
jgi:large subunit ribosomal protein L32